MATLTLGLENAEIASDMDLVASAIGGREDSFEELVRRHQRPITSYVFRIVGEYDASLDVTHEHRSAARDCSGARCR